MAKINKDIIKIAKSIRHQSELERSNRGQSIAIARFDVEMTAPNGTPITHLWLASQPYKPQHIAQYDIVGNFKGTTGSSIFNLKEEGSQYFYKNSAIGVLLTTAKFGTHTYRVPQKAKKSLEQTLTFYTKATYNSGHHITNVAVQIEGEQILRFANLNDLLLEIDHIERQIELKKIEQEERLEKEKQLKAEQKAREEAIIKAKAEEAERIRKEQEALEAEIRRQEELRAKEEEEIKLLEEQQTKALELIQQTNISFRNGQEIRVTPIVDESQTNAKVSHLYDGVPIVIDGGPGTGKTTTSIQRLKFLIDPYLKEHESCRLSEQQISMLTDPNKVSSHWIFFSPSTLLAQYLKSALSIEGLANDIRNVTPFENFLILKLQEYTLTVSRNETKPPFRPIKSSHPLSKRLLIKDGKAIVKGFEEYAIKNLSKPLLQALEVKTSGYDWQVAAIRIQSYCKEAEKVNSLFDLIKLYARIQGNEYASVQEYTSRLKHELEVSSNRVRKSIMADEEIVQYLAILFEDWASATSAVETDEVDYVEEEEPGIDISNLDNRLYRHLKSLLNRLSLKQFDSSIDLSKRQKELYEWIKKYIDEVDLTEIGELAWFQRNFGSLCRGFESAVLNQLVKLYKSFRREQSKIEFSFYATNLLTEIISSSENRLLHHDEQVLLLGVINNLMKSIVKWSPVRFNDMKHPYKVAYLRSIKYVIGVDEASDYSELDYYCISSFAHHDFSAITLCGDIMQGLGKNGINSWETLKKWVFPNIDIFTLKKSYRQWPTLLEVSRQMYKDDLNTEAPYVSALTKLEQEAKPLAFISRDENAKINWLAQRIDEVRSRFDELPSIAIFINDDEDVEAFMQKVHDNENLDKYSIEDCTHGNQGREDSIRVFHLSTVKGMEFEAVFFHNIDSAKIEDQSLLRRYLYVGISRAVSHLGATFSSSTSNVLKYFVTGESWKPKYLKQSP